MGNRTNHMRAAVAGKQKPPILAEPMQVLDPPQPAPKAKKPPKPPRIERGSPKQRDQAVELLGRLPDGAQYSKTWDAAAMLWRGSLVIGLHRFTAEAGGSFKLEAKLDSMWRRHLAGQAAPPTEEPTDART